MHIGTRGEASTIKVIGNLLLSAVVVVIFLGFGGQFAPLWAGDESARVYNWFGELATIVNTEVTQAAEHAGSSTGQELNLFLTNEFTVIGFSRGIAGTPTVCAAYPIKRPEGCKERACICLCNNEGCSDEKACIPLPETINLVAATPDFEINKGDLQPIPGVTARYLALFGDCDGDEFGERRLYVSVKNKNVVISQSTISAASLP